MHSKGILRGIIGVAIAQILRHMAILYISVIGLLYCQYPQAAGLSFADNQVFPHGYVDFKRIDPLAATDYPFASADRKFVFQTSYRSLYNMSELTDNRAAFTFSHNRYDAGMAFASFGETDYFHQLGLSIFASYHTRFLSAGGSIIYSRISFNNKYDALDAVSFNISAAYNSKDIMIFAVTRSVNQPRYCASDPSRMPEVETGISYNSRKGLDSQIKALFIRHQKPAAELSQSFALYEYARLNWALVLWPARFGGGIHLEKGHFGFDYKISHHPVLGMTHTIMLTISKSKARPAAE
jgi:hypothetical protein